MPNTFDYAKAFVPMLDKAYAQNAIFSILDAPADFVREGARANEVLLPSITLQGLADYNKSTGFVSGTLDFAWTTYALTQDRGRSFLIDAMDDVENLDIPVAVTLGEFIRTKVTPESDAYRAATLASKAANAAHAVLDKDTVLPAIDLAIETMRNDEVDEGSMIIFVSPSVKTYLKNSGLITRQFVVQAGPMVINRDIEVLDGKPLVTVPEGRFYTEITLLDGTTSGEEAGGYTNAGDKINFMIVDTNAVLGVVKHTSIRLFDAKTLQSADAHKIDYRIYHDLIVPDNKTKGIYLHDQASGS
jgi:hypothetical protein